MKYFELINTCVNVTNKKLCFKKETRDILKYQNVHNIAWWKQYDLELVQWMHLSCNWDFII